MQLKKNRKHLPNVGKPHAKVNLNGLMAREEKLDALGGKKSPQEAMMEAQINKLGGKDKDAR